MNDACEFDYYTDQPVQVTVDAKDGEAVFVYHISDDKQQFSVTIDTAATPKELDEFIAGLEKVRDALTPQRRWRGLFKR
jgi:hypothetical protein